MNFDNIEPVFLHNWADMNQYDALSEFLGIRRYNFQSDLEFSAAVIYASGAQDLKVLFAVYTDESYSGSAFVLAVVDGVLCEIDGAHCSCHGLENQWEPEPTSIEALRHRIKDGTLGYRDEFSQELTEFLDQLEKATA